MKIKKTMVRGAPRWVVYLGKVNGVRKRRYCETEAEARRVRSEAVAQRKTAGEVWVGLKDHERLEVVNVLAKCRARGLSIGELWQAYVSGGCGKPELVKRTLREAIAETLAAKIAANRRPRYVVALEKYLGMFARGREEMLVSEVTLGTIEAWFAGRKESPKRIPGSIGALSTMFSHCVRKGYIERNPCEHFERPTIEHAAPVIFTPAQVRLAADWVHESATLHLGWFSLALFAGIRPEEIERLSWDDVDLKAGTVTVDAAASKVRARRIVHLEPSALRWVAEAHRVKAPLDLDERQRGNARKGICKVLGLDSWPQDVLRHTCASYMIASKRDAAACALELGNSVGILMRHYRELVSAEDAAAFWQIVPVKQLP